MIEKPQTLPVEEPERDKRKTKQETREIETEHVLASVSSIASILHPERNEDSFLIDSDQELVAVFDGVGGRAAGDIASEMARDLLPIFYKTSKTKISLMKEHDKIALWQKILLSNSYVLEEEIETSDKLRTVFQDDIKEAKKNMDELPDEVKMEAMIIYDALQDLSKEILKTANQKDKTKGMGTTTSGLKFIETSDGRQFAICWGVGDSDVWIERASSGEIFRAVKSDNTLETALGRKTITQKESLDLDNLVIRQWRFSGLMQGLGQDKNITPRIMVWEIFPGDRFILNTDGVSDHDLREKYKTLVRNRQSEPWQEVTESIIDEVLQCEARGEGKGSDDATVIAGEFKLPLWFLHWQKIVNEEINEAKDREGLSEGEIVELKNKIHDLRGEIAKQTRIDSEASGRTDPKEVTDQLRQNLKIKILKIIEELRGRTEIEQN